MKEVFVIGAHTGRFVLVHPTGEVSIRYVAHPVEATHFDTYDSAKTAILVLITEEYGVWFQIDKFFVKQ